MQKRTGLFAFFPYEIYGELPRWLFNKWKEINLTHGSKTCLLHSVSVAAGKYYLNATIVLSESDSEVSWVAAPGAAVTLSGGVKLNPAWKPSASNPKILVGKTAIFEPFIYIMHYFTKTGSGQT